MNSEQENACEAFLQVTQHSFKDYDQSVWISHCLKEVDQALLVLTRAGAAMPLLELLNLIASGRAAFAAQQGHCSVSGEPEFGVLRSGTYDRSIREAANYYRHVLKVGRMLGDHAPEVQLTFTASTSLFRHQDALFEPLIQNLSEAIKSGSGIEEMGLISRHANFLINERLKLLVQIEPEGFFDKARYAELRILRKPDSSVGLSSFYLVQGMSLPFVLVEHPTPRQVAECLQGDANELYVRAMAEQDSSTYLALVSELVWLVCQLMPYLRGSAAIASVLTAALLLAGDISPKKYSGTRLDLDALSLPMAMFRKRFLADYAQQA